MDRTTRRPPLWIWLALAGLLALSPAHAAEGSAPDAGNAPATEATPAEVVAPAPAAVAKPAPQASPHKKPTASPQTRPHWNELTQAQQEALEPLAARWPEISEVQKRKWLALSHNFRSLSAEEKSKLHGRMTEWVALSVQERVQARLNYAQANKLAPEDKKAQWEAYQALSTDEKQKLAQKAPIRPVGAAPVIKPTPAQKLAPVPLAVTNAQRPVKIETGPHQVDPHTLLPQVTPISKTSPASGR